MHLIGEELGSELVKTKVGETSTGYQLKRLSETSARIKNEVLRRLEGRRHAATYNWQDLIDKRLKDVDANLDEDEPLARSEKAAALAELFASRMSVLVGPAGTGKTTLLRVLCELPEVSVGGITLLAPTGKARVRLEQQTQAGSAMTVAQFLLPLGRFDTETGAYLMLGPKNRSSQHKTVIVDEASMLTEEQLAAILDALQGVERLILVGDVRQLPPIGSGRPFVDIVHRLKPAGFGQSSAVIAPGYAELTIQRRQSGGGRVDILLAQWFSGGLDDPEVDTVWDRLGSGAGAGHVQLVKWSTPEELRACLVDLMSAELRLGSTDDHKGFERSLGGVEYNGDIYFHRGREGKAGASAGAEGWQILSPVHPREHGVEALNRFVQQQFRREALRNAQEAKPYARRIPKPIGTQKIIYGDKVINVRNMRRPRVYPEEDALRYVANGEIGIVVGEFRGKSWKLKRGPRHLEVEFSTQGGHAYTFWSNEFGEENEPPLELAYAITVHKSQGSEFGTVFLIIPERCHILSRELLYTALTRHQHKLYVLHQGDPIGLLKFSYGDRSDTARRLTNLFDAPRPIEDSNRLMEEGLIHRTLRQESVRSKSEVIIANLLHAQGIDYAYEKKFTGLDGTSRYPDFTIEDASTGQLILIEHLGMLRVPSYSQKWEKSSSGTGKWGLLKREESLDF